MDFYIVYDILTANTSPFFYVPILGFALGLIFFILSRKYTFRNMFIEFSETYIKGIGIFAMAISLIWGLGVIPKSLLEKHSIVRFVKSGDYLTIEGQIEHCNQYRQDGSNPTFSVNDIVFNTSEYIIAFNGFEDEENKFIKNGVTVRISYLPEKSRNRIIRFEIMR
jgi:hypothetical protein